MSERSGPVFVVDGLRTPRAAVRGGRGALSAVAPVELLAGLLRALPAGTGFDPRSVEQFVAGCVTQIGEQGGNIAARSLAAAGWHATTAETINRYCASGLAAINTLAARVGAGEVGVGVAGGVESMSRVPMGSDRTDTGDPANEPVPTGVAADLLAAAYGVGRAELDEYAVGTQSRAAAAVGAGYLTGSIVTMPGASLDHDDAVRAGATTARLAQLEPAFGSGHSVEITARARARWPRLGVTEPVHTAGTSPAMADGAAVVVLAGAAALARHGLRPRARIVATASAAVDSVAGPWAAIEAARTALDRAGLTADALDLVECHEAFAVTPILFARELALDTTRLNVNGGTIALGHPMGACGAMLTISLLDELERREGRLGLVAISGAAGMGAAAVLELTSEAR